MPNAPSLRILVVEDDRELLAMLSVGLEALGHVVSARTRAEALARTSDDVDGAVLALHLQDGDALSLAAELRARAPALRLVALTGDIRRGLAACKSVGFDAVALKPVSLAQLVAMLRGDSTGQLARFD